MAVSTMPMSGVETFEIMTGTAMARTARWVSDGLSDSARVMSWKSCWEAPYLRHSTTKDSKASGLCGGGPFKALRYHINLPGSGSRRGRLADQHFLERAAQLLQIRVRACALKYLGYEVALGFEC